MANVKRASSQLTTFGLRKEEALVTLLGEAQDQLTLGMAGAGVTGSYLPLAGGTMTGTIASSGDMAYDLGGAAKRWNRLFVYTLMDSASARITFGTNGALSYNLYRDASSDSASTISHIFDTGSALNTSGALLMSIRNNGVEKAGINRNGAFFSASAISVPAMYPYASTGISLYPLAPDGATAVGLTVDNLTTLSTAGAKLLSLKNNGTEKLAISKDGAIVFGGGTYPYLTVSGDNLWFYSANYTVGILSSIVTGVSGMHAFDGATLALKAYAPNNASANALIVDTFRAYNVSGAKLLSIRNLGVEKAFVDYQGGATAYGFTNTNGTFSSTRTDSALFINSYNADTANAPAVIVDSPTGMTASGTKLLSIRNAGVEKAYFDSYGGLYIGTTLVGLSTVTTGALYTNVWGATTDNSPSIINTWVADGANAVALSMNQGHALSTTGAKLLSILNNSVEKFYISKDGDVYVRGTLLGSASPATTSAVGTVRLNVTPGDAANPIVLTLNTSNIFSTGAYSGITTNSSSLPLTFYMGGAYPGEMDFADSVGNVKMYLTSGGTLGIPSGANAILFSQAAASIMFNYHTQALASNASGLTINSSQVLTAGNVGSYAAPLASPTFTGTVTTSALTVNSTLTLGNIWGYLNSGFAFRDGGVGTLSFYTSGGAASGASINLSTGQVNGTSGVFSSTLSSGALTVTGAITATGNITAYYSDRRLKRDIRPIPGALAKLDRLRGVEWAWDEMACFNAGFKPDTATDYGFVAQELEYVLPNAVGPNGAFLAVKASNQGVLALAVEAIKELRGEVAMLRARVEELERE